MFGYLHIYNMYVQLFNLINILEQIWIQTDTVCLFGIHIFSRILTILNKFKDHLSIKYTLCNLLTVSFNDHLAKLGLKTLELREFVFI